MPSPPATVKVAAATNRFDASGASFAMMRTSTPPVTKIATMSTR